MMLKPSRRLTFYKNKTSMNTQLKKKLSETVQKALKLENDPKWTLDSRDPNPIYILEKGDTVLSKGVTNLPYSPEEVVKYIMDINNAKSFDHHMESAKLLQQDGDDFVAYYQYESMLMVSGRDFVVGVTNRKLSANRFIIAVTSVDQLPENPDYVRGQVHVVSYIIDRIDARNCTLTYLTHSDLKGSIPNFLKNKVNVSVAERPTLVAKAMRLAGHA